MNTKSNFLPCRLLTAAFLAAIASPATASVLTFDFTATVNSIVSSGDVSGLVNLGAGLAVSDTVHGSFSYDTAAPATFAEPGHIQYDASISVILPAFSIANGPVKADVFNDYLGVLDGFVVQASVTTFVPFSSMLAYSLSLVDFSQAALSTTDLPTSFDLAAFPSRQFAVFDRKFNTDGVYGDQTVNFTLESVAAAVPETSTWAMMILGFAGVGFMAYRRKSGAIAA